MDEKERIRNMVAAGTITDAEAERLLSVLDEIDGAEAELAASGEAMETEARHAGTGAAGEAAVAAPAPAGAGAAEPAGAATAQPASAKPASAQPASVGPGNADPASARPPDSLHIAPGGTRWLHLSLLAGDIDVRADATLEEVELSGHGDWLRLERAPDGYTLRHEREAQGDSWVDRFLGRLRGGKVHVRVPAGYGLDLDVTAGDVDLEGVPYLRGRLTSGDLSARGLRGVDLVTAAGDIDLDMTLTEGRHRLRATAGDVDVRLGAGSSVTVDGSVSIGSASVRAPGFDVDRRGIGQRFEGRVGDGAASLEVHVTTGDIDVKVVG